MKAAPVVVPGFGSLCNLLRTDFFAMTFALRRSRQLKAVTDSKPPNQNT
jgi:hypothetical protein